MIQASFSADKSKVATIAPMKRGLKDQYPNRLIGVFLPTCVATIAPMKRGLKGENRDLNPRA